MTNTQYHAKRELDILAQAVPDAVIIPFKNEILALCEAFGRSGQSGGSAPLTASVISQAVKTLLMHETLAPLTGEEYEWTEVSHDGKPVYQNNRDSRVFKSGEHGRAYFIDAIVFDGDVGGRFSSGGSVTHNGEKISSTQYIKSFPFAPKTFFVDVFDFRFKDKEEKELDVNGDWWAHVIKDETQLNEVFAYYDKFSV